MNDYMRYNENPLDHIEYWYDVNIKLYTFQYMDSDRNDICPPDYCTKHNLLATKENIKEETGKPIIRFKNNR